MLLDFLNELHSLLLLKMLHFILFLFKARSSLNLNLAFATLDWSIWAGK